MTADLDNKRAAPIAGQADPNAQLPPEEDILEEGLESEPTGKPEEEGKDKEWYPGKYKTPEEGLRGIKETESYATQLAQENAELKKHLAGQQLQQQPSGNTAEKFKEYWSEKIEKDPIMAFAQMADEAARHRIQQAMTYNQSQQMIIEQRKKDARDKVAGYREAEHELDKYYNTLDPILQQTISASPKGEEVLLNLYKGAGNTIPKARPTTVPYVEGSGRSVAGEIPADISPEMRRFARNMGVTDEALKERVKVMNKGGK